MFFSVDPNSRSWPSAFASQGPTGATGATGRQGQNGAPGLPV